MKRTVNSTRLYHRTRIHNCQRFAANLLNLSYSSLYNKIDFRIDFQIRQPPPSTLHVHITKSPAQLRTSVQLSQMQHIFVRDARMAVLYLLVTHTSTCARARASDIAHIRAFPGESLSPARPSPPPSSRGIFVPRARFRLEYK